MVGRSPGESPKSMLAIRRVAARADGMPMAMPQRASASVSRRTSQRTFCRRAPTATRMPISRVRRVEADASEQQGEGGEESGEESRHALFGERLAGGLLNGLCFQRVFVAERFDLVADGFGQSFGGTAGPHEKIASLDLTPLLETLEIREIHQRRSSITQI